MLQFDADIACILDDAYLGGDFARRRAENLAALDPAPGAEVADIGAGIGHLAAELARRVGPEGTVHAIDPSADMLARARDKLAGLPQVRIAEGTADRLPLPDRSLDGAVSVQVFEYIADLDAALAEAHRVLKPGARLVIGDLHFGTLAWHSDDPARMDRIIAAWDSHFVWRDLPAHLPARLRAAGFTVDEVTPVITVDRQLRPDGLARMMLILMERHALAAGHADAPDWRAEQEALAVEGRFFFSLTHFVTRAVRRGGGLP